VIVDSDSLYMVDGKIWTSAGVTAGIDMAPAMAARDLDAVIAGEPRSGCTSLLSARMADARSHAR
jgi:transcriptional regulator GlxA family with amidase domain